MDQAYVEDAGAALARFLYYRSRTCEIAYTPGNGTLYELVFVPLGLSPAVAAISSMMDHERARSIRQDRPQLDDGETAFLLAWPEHGAYYFDLSQLPAAPWIAEKLNGTLGDGEALHELLAAAARHCRLPFQVTR